MARPPRPWFRSDRDAWYVQVGGKRHLLARGKENKATAERAFHRLMAAEGRSDVEAITVGDLANLFLAHAEAACKPATWRWYAGHVLDFAARWRDLAAAAVRPLHVARWLEQRQRAWAAKGGGDWSDSTRRGAMTVVKAMTAWGHRQGHLAADPLRGMARPRMGRRRAVDPEAARRLREAADGPLGDLLAALWGSGCRPGQVFALTAADVDLAAGCWRVPFKARRGDGRTHYRVPISPGLAAVCRRLCAAHPEGPIFRNGAGNPWNRQAVGARFRRLRAKLGLPEGTVAYGFRHRYATDGAMAGVPQAALAELLGHSSTRMLDDHYVHAAEERARLAEAAGRFRGPTAPPGTPPGSPSGPPDAGTPG